MAALGRIFRWGDQRQWNFLNIPVHQQRDFLVLQETKTHIFSVAVIFTMPTQKSFGYLQSTREMLADTNRYIRRWTCYWENGGNKAFRSSNRWKTENCRGPSAAKLSLYKSSILLHLTYCYLVWHFCNTSDRRKLERIQERALRATYKTRSASHQELLDRAKLPTLYNRRLQDIASSMFKVKHSPVPVNISDLFNIKNTQYKLRNSDFEPPRFETVRFGRNSLKYMGPLIWSKLPRHLK